MYTKNLKELSYKDVAEAGGKGASLGEMLQAGFLIPEGFVVLAPTFEKFLEQAGIEAEIETILKSVNIEAMHTVEAASEKIQYLILNAQISENISEEIISSFNTLNAKFVAVRSSATAEDSADAAWAGQLETFLNTTKENVLKNIRKCWASLFSPRAIFYRFEKKLHDEHVSVAVVVQKMVQSDSAGIAFSVHPVTQDHNQILIEAGFGLGESVVSGAVTPDSFVINKKDHSVLSKSVHSQTKKLVRTSEKSVDWVEIPESEANKQKITNELLFTLSKEIEKIESHYKFPVDVEWAIENDKIYITQSRPITTLDSSSNVKSSIVSEILSEEWNKDWENKYSLFLSSASCKTYFSPMQEIVGFCFSKILITHKEGITSCYHLIEDYETFGNHLANTIVKNPEIVERWVFDLKQCADSIREFISRLNVKTFNVKELEKICELLDVFGAHHIPNKTVINFLSEDLFKKYAPLLEDGRKYIETVYHDIDAFGEKLIEEIKFRNKSYTIEELSTLLLEEAYVFFEKGVLPSKKILKSRFTNSGLLLTKSNDSLIISGEDVDKIKNYWVTELQTNTIKGKATFPGKVKGKCRLITNYRKDATLQEGEILVTGMTDPNFVPLMKKAAAIVTDAGGLLSHAAIVSRELKIPCVVGTKVATSLLKTGDVVEVDAGVGVVRKMDLAIQWEHFISRPFNLFTASVWHEWYASKLFYDVIGTSKITEKSIEIQKEFVRNYRDTKEFVKFKDAFDVLVKEPEKIKTLLEKGITSNKLAIDRLKSDLSKMSIEAEIKFLIENSLYATILPYWIYLALEKQGDVPKDIAFLCEELRGESYYPKILQEIIIPLAKQRISNNFDPEDLKYLTIRELLAEDFSKIEERKKLSETKSFILTYVNNQETIEWVSDPQKVVDELEGLSDKLQSKIKGTIANKGSCTGKAKVLFGNNLDVEFNKGDILVATSTSPTLMPLIRKAGAIVTDEGGAMCHAAIVSRELGIPCIIGTKNATKFLKDGDLVKVDADTGVVEKLNTNLLTKIFSRERPLIYFNMWDDSDRMGFKDFLDLEVEQNYFVKEQNSKTSVYYPQHFLELFDEILKEKAGSTLPNAIQRMKKEWPYLLPYLRDESKISSYKELIEYYNHLISWWSGMTAMFTVPNILKDNNLVSELLELRKESEKYSDKMCSVMTNFLKNKFPLEFDIITINEVKDLNDDKEIDLSFIQQRKEGYVMDNGVVKVNSSFDKIVGQKGYSISGSNNEFSSDITEIKGNVAFSGKVSGKVRIVKVSTDLKEIQDGDIIVTEMTSPSYVPYLKKANAIITDEGGITCHAAIVSRELKKPCIIGTKNATKFLKDGDLVEVDADKGIVRKV